MGDADIPQSPTSELTKSKFDSHIVKTVRTLKSTNTIKPNSKNSINLLNNSQDKTSGDSSTPPEEKNPKQMLSTPLKQITPKSKTIRQSHIAIDGSEKQIQPEEKENLAQSMKLQIKAKNKKIGIYNFNLTSSNQNFGLSLPRELRKRKSIYIQNLMNDINIKKYKLSCISLVKSDMEIAKLYEKCGYEKSNYSYESFVNENFFGRKIFLYQLEMLLKNNEMNFLVKNYKERFFKEKILKFLKEKILNDKMKGKLQEMMGWFDKCFELINTFEFNK